MTGIFSVSPRIIGILQMFVLILCIASLYCIASGVVNRLPIRHTWPGLASFLLNYALLYPLYCIGICRENGAAPDRLTELFGRVPALFVAAAAVLLAVFVVYDVVRQQRISEVMLTPMSIKESNDKLPSGLCFCDERGAVLLVNHRMDGLCFRLTGDALLNAAEFWRRLSEGEVMPEVRPVITGERPMFELDDGGVWLFERVRLGFERAEIYQITAADVTGRFRLGEELDEEIRSLRRMNEELRAYGDTMYELTREEELLAAKVSIHDSIGQALLTARRYIESGDETIDHSRLLQIWRYSVELLRHEGSVESADSPIKELEEAAKLVGVKLVANGEPPGESGALRLMTVAALECINNAARHAGATELYISSREENGRYILEFTNNGDAPEHEIIEGGGLSELRRKAEKEGAQMETEWKGGFLLRISAAAKGGLEDDGSADSGRSGYAAQAV